MILDSSAILAMLLREDGHDELRLAFAADPEPAVGAPTLLETGIVAVSRLGVPGRTLLLRFLTDAGVAVIPFGDEHWRVALDAFRRFGRGRHPAGLNLGDCFTYATARVADEPLLCTGDDFPQTDLPLVE